MALVLGCKATNLPIMYLGLLFGAEYKDVKTWEPIIEMFDRWLARWKKNFLSKAGRLTLIKSTLVNLPIYYLSIFNSGQYCKKT